MLEEQRLGNRKNGQQRGGPYVQCFIKLYSRQKNNPGKPYPGIFLIVHVLRSVTSAVSFVTVAWDLDGAKPGRSGSLMWT